MYITAGPIECSSVVPATLVVELLVYDLRIVKSVFGARSLIRINVGIGCAFANCVLCCSASKSLIS